ncbi:DUF1758 domain-containing protein [Trichonephila clavipes]|nr:DUF1758 domain-containing protein [Trichonephila clavipes]
MFANVKGFKKEDLLLVAEEIGEIIPAKVTTSDLKNLILNNDEYKKDSDFVTSVLITAVEDWKQREEVRKEEIDHKEKQSQRQYKLELARIQAQSNVVEVSENLPLSENNAKRKFHLPKLEFRKFSGNIKDWLPFWSQFEHIHKDGDMARKQVSIFNSSYCFWISCSGD